ncbi:hypothetical protein QLQ12_36345 [Actinoplanes sp. NEAU-A12]|uniref:Uncharacterized protein n=1 Tax=Actinoplanes sandaracinus TaxID=3045177 RepID=A0ABT6WWT7_9ACTN|nr:hypothetical protein [Actinoplanes sandaracinus]MDI6104076.1 hypothetical protein [Actinoplanes sandaracinus]
MTDLGDDERLIREARRLAAERRAAARQTREADALARSVVEAAAGKPVIEYLRERADTADLRTPVNGTLLWSHVHQVRRGAPVSNQDLAAAFARDPRRSSPVPLPIHLTPGGEWFAKVLDNPGVRRKLVSPRERAELWQVLSRRFAGQARGRVLVFAATAHPKSYLYRHELPLLRRNPAVGPGRIMFVHAVGNSAGGTERAATGTSYPQARVRADRRIRSGQQSQAAYVAAKRPPPAKSNLIKALLWCVGLFVIADNPQEFEQLVTTLGVWYIDFLESQGPRIVDFLEEWDAR